MTQENETEQIGIIVASHGDYAAALLRAAEFILGPLTNCTSISIDTAYEVDETVRRLEDAASRLSTKAGVIILTDMFGGTPTNLSLALLAKYKLEVVTGVNLPMLLKTFGSRHMELETLAKLAEEAGKAGIVVAGVMLEKNNTKPKK